MLNRRVCFIGYLALEQPECHHEQPLHRNLMECPVPAHPAWEEGNPPWMRSAQCTVGKSTLSCAAQTWGAQHLAGHKFYLLPVFFLPYLYLYIFTLFIFLFLFCGIKTAILLSHLLLGFSYWDSERTLHPLSLSVTSWCKTTFYFYIDKTYFYTLSINGRYLTLIRNTSISPTSGPPSRSAREGSRMRPLVLPVFMGSALCVCLGWHVWPDKYMHIGEIDHRNDLTFHLGLETNILHKCVYLV